MEDKFNAKKVLLTTSCTAALEMAAILCNLNEEHEVILPSFTFVSTANAFYIRSARLRFVDIRPDTLNMDENQIESAISTNTKVIVPVHYSGVGCEMDKIMDIAQRKSLYVVEDAAQGVNAKYKGKFLGTIGDLGTYSFHETKNFTCGEGGAIVINNDKFIERAELIREKGTNRSKFFRGEIDKYTWVDIGSSFLPSDLLAAFLYAQLEEMEKLSRKRCQIFFNYHEMLMPLHEEGLFSIPPINLYSDSNYHLFYILLRKCKVRNDLMNYLKSKGFSAIFHYVPLHLSSIGLSLGYKKGDFPISEKTSDCLLRLPFFYDLTKDIQYKIVKTIKQFFKIKYFFLFSIYSYH